MVLQKASGVAHDFFWRKPHDLLTDVYFRTGVNVWLARSPFQVNFDMFCRLCPKERRFSKIEGKRCFWPASAVSTIVSRLHLEIPPHRLLQSLTPLRCPWSSKMSTPDTQSLAFECPFCQRRFKRLEHVQRHERTHTKEAPYKCPCGRAFPRGYD